MDTEKFKGIFPAFYACYDNGEINIVAIKQNNKIEISIEDFGKGMDEKTLKNLFTSIKIFSYGFT